MIAERSFPSMHGFLAVVLNFALANEWFACTEKGWVFAEITDDKRVFQSAKTPLPKINSAPQLGVANSKTGLALQVTLKDVKPQNSLDNVLIHANPRGSGGIFFAWCDGITVRQMDVGESWRVSVEVRLLMLDEMLSVKE